VLTFDGFRNNLHRAWGIVRAEGLPMSVLVTDVIGSRTTLLTSLVLHGIYAALPLLKATPGSVCFTTSSSAATYGAPSLAAYTATKFAVKGLTEALAVELSRCDARVADVLPGVIDTAIFGDSPVFVAGRKLGPDERPAGPEPASEGPFRLVPPSLVAEAVWRCCDGDARLHWYVPEEIEDIEKAKVASPEQVRDARIAIQKASTGG